VDRRAHPGTRGQESARYGLEQQRGESVRFAPWREETWDVNDTVDVTDPSTDPDVGGFFARLPAEAWSPTWHAARSTGALGALERAAAEKALVHAGTPTVAHLDALRRAFVTVEHNRIVRNGAPVDDLYTNGFISP